MRLSPLVALFSSSVILHVNADLHHSPEEEEELSVILLANHQADQRDLQVPCPLGEAWDERLRKCIAVSCDSQNACNFGETCTPVRRYCQGDMVCPQYRCDSPCPAYEQKDPSTGQCAPVSCSSPRACSNAPAGKICRRTSNNNCVPGQFCPRFLCCDDISRCDSLYCAYGKLNGPDGCPICDCKDCYGYGPGGGGGSGRNPMKLRDRARQLDRRHRKNRDCPYGHEVNEKGCPLDSCRAQPW